MGEVLLEREKLLNKGRAFLTKEELLHKGSFSIKEQLL